MASKFEAEVVVTIRKEVADPQGQAIEEALGRLAWFSQSGASVQKLRAGKVFRFEIDAADEAQASSVVEALADKVLANPNTESFEHRVRAKP